MATPPANHPGKSFSQQSERVISTIAICILAGIFGILLYSTLTSTLAEFFAVLGVSLLIAGAATVSGGMIGFLFGIPKTLQQETPEKPPAGSQAEEQGNHQAARYGVNTNLEQISDWLTKILVGVGLTQLRSIPEGLKNYAEFVAPGLGKTAAAGPYAVALLIFYLVCGFLISYLWTRIYLAGALREADLSALNFKLQNVSNKVSELERQAAIDARALSIAQNQLNPGPGTTPIPQEEINRAIEPASRAVKAQIFYLAQEVRAKNWRDPSTKEIMERTIPLFRALALSDKKDEFHLNHGQLGFALKDQRLPDWEEAERELSKAISIRDRLKIQGWLFYEFNRAVCRIQLDARYRQDVESDAQTRAMILEDLKAAARAPDLIGIIESDPTIQDWLRINKIGAIRNLL